MFINPINKNKVINQGERVPQQDIFQAINKSLNWQGLNDHVQNAGNPMLTGIMGALQSGLNTYDTLRMNNAAMGQQDRRDDVNKQIAESLKGHNFHDAAALSAAEGLSNDAMQYSALGNQRDLHMMDHSFAKSTAAAKQAAEEEAKKNAYMAEKEEGNQLLSQADAAIDLINNNYGQSGGWLSGGGIRRYFDDKAEETRAKTLGIASRIGKYMSSGVAGAQLNSNEEGKRVLNIFANPGDATTSELKSAIEYARKYIRDKQGVNAIKMGYDPNKEVVGGYTIGSGANQIKNAVDLAAKRRKQLNL